MPGSRSISIPAPQGEVIAPLVAALVKRRGIAPAATDIRFGLDPLGAAAAARWQFACRGAA